MYYPKQIPYLLDKEFKENIEYVSCDESIAKVSDQGKITGVSVGKTNIIVKQIKNEEEKILKNYVVVVNKIIIKN